MRLGGLLHLVLGIALLLGPSLRPGLGATEPASRWDALAEPAFDHFGLASGMTHNFVTTLAQDRDGFIWIGTEAGLDRYDGYRFRAFKHNPTDPSSMPGNYVTALYVDAAGQLWIGTDSAGLARYDSDHDRFVRYGTGPGVTSIAEDGAGGLWVGTNDGLDHLDPASGHVESLPNDPENSADNRIWSLLRDREGRLWVGSGNGLKRQDRPGEPFHKIAATGAGVAEALADSVTALRQDSHGRLWFGTYHSGAFCLDPATGIATAVGEPPHQLPLGGQQIEAISEIAPGKIWIASDGLGITVSDRATEQVVRLRASPTAPTGLVDDHVTALLTDRSGLVWVGTERGLDRFEPDATAAVTLYGGPGYPGGLSDSSVTAVTASADGLIWLGLGDHGLDIVDPARGRLATLTPGGTPGRPARGIDALAADIGGGVWIGTDLGLYHAGARGVGLAPVPMPGGDPVPDITTLVPHGGDLWIGTGEGLLRYQPASGAVTAYRAGPGGLSDERVQAVQPMPDGSLWIGTAHGLNRLDPATGRIDRFLPDPGDPAALAASDVESLTVDRHGRLWVGLYGGGIDVLQGLGTDGKPRFHSIGLPDGLPDEIIDALITDQAGRIWASTDNRLAEIDPDTLAIRRVQAADGVRVRGYWAQSATMTAQGELLFGGDGGVSVVRPDQISQTAPAPHLVLTEARVAGRKLGLGALNRGDKDAAITLAAGEHGFEVEFAALDYVAADQMRYAYSLDGFDPTWVDATRRRAAVYTNLPPGDYVLRLRVTDRAGNWIDPPRAVPIHIIPAWYQTWWARLGAILASVGLIYGLVRARTAYLSYRKAELERLVAQQTAELLAANRELARLATEDVLTGAINRRTWLEQAGQEQARASRTGRGFAVLFADIDHFKRINDAHGHPAGDAVLRAVANRLAAACRTEDTMGRYGGEEFVILMPEATTEQAVAAGERLRHAIAASPIDHDGMAIEVTISIGVSGSSQDGLDGVIARADRALYAAKREGRNRVELAAPFVPV